MPNNLEKAIIFQNTLDAQMIQQATTGFLEANSSQVKYNGGNELKVASIITDGLKDYDRAGGFGSAGSVDLTFESHLFDKDRAQTFSLDSQDVDETNFMATATNVMTQFQRTQVIPEVDSYRYSKIYSIASQAGKSGEYTPDVATIFQQLTNDISLVEDVIGEGEDLVICMSIPTATTLDNADKIEKKLDMMDFAQGAMSRKVKSLDGMPIIKVSSARLKTAYTFLNADPYGFEAVEGAMDINWIIMARRSAIAITKTDKPRIWNPDQNINADAYKIDYRKYHTLIIPKNKVAGVFVSRKPATSPTFALLTANNTTTVTITGGVFTAGVTIGDFSFTGTDAVAIAAGSLVRTSDTVVTITHATGNTGTDNAVTVLENGLENGAVASIVAAGSTV